MKLKTLLSKLLLSGLLCTCPLFANAQGTLVINEVLADPASGDAGDANGDGSRSSSQDEFVEIVNGGSLSLDVSGLEIHDGFGLRHTFPENSVLPSQGALVVFGGGSPAGLFGASVVQVASTGSLGLNNGGDVVSILSTQGDTLLVFEYTGSFGGDDQSMTRTPDVRGDFVKHNDVNALLFSPGTQNDGKPFSGNPQPITSFAEDFDTCAIDIQDWTVINESGPTQWSCTSEGNEGSEAVAITGSRGEDSDWLISPPLNLRFFDFPALTFSSFASDSGATLRVRVSTDYSGEDDPTLASWTDLPFSAARYTSGTWAETMAIDLSGYKSSATSLAFYLESSDTSAGFSWKIDDILIRNESAPVPGINPVSIAMARSMPEGSIVTLEGTLTVVGELGGPSYLQDASAGIAIFDRTFLGDSNYSIGDVIRITGIRGNRNEQLQVADLVLDELIGTKVVNPGPIALSELAAHRGELVSITGARFPQPEQGLLWGNSNFTLSDASGEGQLRIDSDVTDLVGKAQPDTCTVTGVVGYFRGIPQILPRQLADIPCAEPFEIPNSGMASDATLDVVTWNVEWFGNTGNGPSPEEEQKENVKKVVLDIDADVYAFQEIADEALFQEMADELSDYEALISFFVSSPPNTPGSSQKVAYLYKKSVVEPVEARPLLATVHPRYNGGDDSLLPGIPRDRPELFWSSGRLPFLMVANVTLQGNTKQYHFVNIHAKANTGNGSYARRAYDVAVLKDSLDTYFDSENIVLLGDYNDDVDETVAGNDAPTPASSYAPFVNDSIAEPGDGQYYHVATQTLSERDFRSFVSRPNMIDHITVSDELKDNLRPEATIVRYDTYNPTFDRTTSDHLPVFVSLDARQEPAQVSELVLMNLDNNENSALVNGQIIDMAQVDDFSILAKVEGDRTVKSVVFKVNGKRFSIENFEPYAISGDFFGVLKPFRPKAGKLTVTATPYSERFGRGIKGKAISYQLEIINTASIEAFELIDTNNHQLRDTLSDGDTVSRFAPFNIKARIAPNTAKSVAFRLNGQLLNIDNRAPFAAGPELNGDFFPLSLSSGKYSLSATPFSEKFGRGIAGITKTVEFSVERASKKILTVFPNPTFGSITITNPVKTILAADITISVSDAFNTTVMTKTFSDFRNQYTLDLSMLNFGIYIVHLRYGNSLYSKRILKF